MGIKIRNHVSISVLTSWICFILFILFYVFAALKYPGGTYKRPDQKGFSFTENYLCDLLDDLTYELTDNPAKVYARISLGFLCLGVFLFWYYFPFLFNPKSKLALLSRFCGMLAMLVTVLLSTENHDTITNISGVLGCLALFLGLYELFRNKRWTMDLIGLLLLSLILLNYYIYESRHWIDTLPLIQKFTMILGLGWFVLIGMEVKKTISI